MLKKSIKHLMKGGVGLIVVQDTKVTLTLTLDVLVPVWRIGLFTQS